MTRPDGQEIHRMVWIEEEDRDRLDPLLEEILNRAILRGNDQLQQALVAKLTERVLGTNIETAFTGRRLQEADRNGTSSLSVMK